MLILAYSNTQTQRGPVVCHRWLILLPTVKMVFIWPPRHSWCDIPFTSAQISYHSHICRAPWLYLMTFRWYKDSISRFLSARDPNETLAVIISWRPTGKKKRACDLFWVWSHSLSNHCHWQHSIGLYPTVLVAQFSLPHCKQTVGLRPGK